MAKFLLLYHGGSMPESDAEMAKIMGAWTNWYTGLGSAVVDAGNPTTPIAKMVSSSGGVSDYSGDGMVSGYTLLEASSLDEAVNMAKGCPVLQGGARIGVFETFNVM